ncbi:manganese efflux pump MntP family protein [Fodinisporobacter ferrooxydans]|uniref:Putative manganese efflux pump MntP n=1 Tax=Fodinisporobacter ferrooxydans TaxID=2901836 RepID=A0ABY4CME8_9BACL|nr:manganese efflux pump MntP family protein [Alicyclobacillaceae bacterium MYW30-H2]
MHFQMSMVQQFITLLLVAIALGMDAMSLGLGIGMKGLRNVEIAKISLTIGIFHVIMPLIGMFLGLYLHKIVGDITQLFGAILLIVFGLQMLYHAIRPDHAPEISKTAGWGLLLFAMSVSVDALSVGFSLGLFEVHIGLVVTLFGIVGASMAAIGLAIGTRVSQLLGTYSEVLGGLILLVFGLKFLF